MNSLPTGKRKSELGLSNNKDVAIQSILGIRIHCFRSLKDQSLILGKNVTVPILASPNEDGTYTVKDGNRRTTALKLLNNPALCPEPDLVPKITKIATAHKNFPSQVDLTVTNNESVMISEVLSRHQGEMAGAGQMGWSAYLRTLYLLNHDHPAEYKRPGQYALWAEGQGIFVEDEFPITSLQRFFTIENLQLLGFDIDANDELCLNLPLATARQIATKVVGDFGGGKSVNEVFTPDQARQYIDEVRISAGLPSAVIKALATSANSWTPSLSLSPPTNTAPSTVLTSSVSSPLPRPSTAVPSTRVSATPVTSSADRKKVFGARSPGIAIPATGHPKEQTLMAELRALDVSKFPLAATMLTRALIELSDLHYRTKNSLQDQTQLSKNIKKSAQHMLSNGKLNASEEDMVKRLCNPSGAMIEIESLQKMVHRKTHNLDRQFVNTLWDNIGCFVKACWA